MSEDVAGGRTPDEEALVEEIEQTRQQLGATVEALAAKTDVKGRAQRRAAQVTGNLRGKAHEVKDKVTEQAGELRHEAAAKASQAKQTVQASSAPTRQQVAARAVEAARAAREVTPPPVQRSARQLAGAVRAHPGIVAATAGALILAWLAMRRLSR